VCRCVEDEASREGAEFHYTVFIEATRGQVVLTNFERLATCRGGTVRGVGELLNKRLGRRELDPVDSGNRERVAVGEDSSGVWSRSVRLNRPDK
jgi:hypothetical protein